jgi:hypothetical protein
MLELSKLRPQEIRSACDDDIVMPRRTRRAMTCLRLRSCLMIATNNFIEIGPAGALTATSLDSLEVMSGPGNWQKRSTTREV